MAKWSWVSRRLVQRGGLAGIHGYATAGPVRSGVFAAAAVIKVGQHEFLEDPNGRRLRLYPGDVLIGAFGNRYATDFYEGYVPTRREDPVHLLTAGGLLGTVASAHSSRGEPTQLRLLGLLTGPDGRTVSTEDVAMPRPAPPTGRVDTVLVLGSSMNAGKTTTTSAIVRGLTRAGLRVGAGKVTGSASGNDYWSYVDAGAATVVDFLDIGMPSTFGYPVARLAEGMVAIRGRLVADGAQAVVLEIADGVLQEETRGLIGRLPGFADAVVLAAGDALSALAGVRLLDGMGVPVRALSGLLTASPLAIREARAATGRPVLGPVELEAGAAAELLARAGCVPDVPTAPLAVAGG
jgi:hypothetical protein